MSEVVIEALVRRELWHSFGSLLRSYGSEKGTCGRNFSVREAGETIHLTRAGSQFVFRMDFDSGKGEIHFPSECVKRSEAFDLKLDGTIDFSGSPQPLDMAAIGLLERLSRLAQDSEDATIVAVLAAIL